MWLKDPMTNTVPDGTVIEFFVMLMGKSIPGLVKN
jgi:hypothetical protein